MTDMTHWTNEEIQNALALEKMANWFNGYAMRRAMALSERVDRRVANDG